MYFNTNYNENIDPNKPPLSKVVMTMNEPVEFLRNSPQNWQFGVAAMMIFILVSDFSKGDLEGGLGLLEQVKSDFRRCAEEFLNGPEV